MIDAVVVGQRLDVDVLVGVPRWIGGRIDQSGAVDYPVDRRSLPAGACRHERRCQRSDVEPAPPGRSATAEPSRAVMKVVAIDVDTHLRAEDLSGPEKAGG